MQLITALGNEAACGEMRLPEGCCMLVTVIVAKRCHCYMPMPKQARGLPCSTPSSCLPAVSLLADARKLSSCSWFACVHKQPSRIAGHA
jgi:hypothetical protein